MEFRYLFLLLCRFYGSSRGRFILNRRSSFLCSWLIQLIKGAPIPGACQNRRGGASDATAFPPRAERSLSTDGVENRLLPSA